MMRKTLFLVGSAFFLSLSSQAVAQAIVAATIKGNTQRVEREISQGADPSMRNTVTGQSLLAIAISRGHEDIVRLLVDAGANLELGWPQLGKSPLVYAAESGNMEITKLLISAGANVNHTDPTVGGAFGTPLSAAAYNGHKDIVRLLIGAGADLSLEQDTLKMAASRGHDAVVAVLKEAGCTGERSYRHTRC